MGSELDKEHAEKIWGRELINSYEKDRNKKLPFFRRNELRDEKIRIAKDLCDDLFIRPFVKLIGISGSVAAGIMKENDDIDLFIVVADHFSWIYRFFAKLRLGSRVIWFGNKNKRNNICLNFISEERGLLLDGQDIFNMHEIYYLVPIYGMDYYDKILASNKWLSDKFYAKIPPLTNKNIKEKVVSMVFLIPNFFAFVAQVLYMLLLRHKPEIKRLVRSYRKGRIEFYKSDFRPKKLEKFYINSNKDGDSAE